MPSEEDVVEIEEDPLMSEQEETDTLHVHPVGDQVDHTLTDDCVCGPESRPVKRDDGSVGWLVVHHSLDGREQHEEV